MTPSQRANAALGCKQLTSFAKESTSWMFSKNSSVAASLSGRLSYAFSSQDAISCLQTQRRARFKKTVRQKERVVRMRKRRKEARSWRQQARQ